MKNSEFGSIIGRESPIFRSTWVMGPYQQILVSSTLAFTVQLVVNLETLSIYSMRGVKHSRIVNFGSVIGCESPKFRSA